MSTHLAQFERSRNEFTTSLHAVADSLRSCAEIAEKFAKQINHSEYSPELAEMLNDENAKGKRRAHALSPEEDGPKKRKRNTKPKDPNAPKRPASSYILFQNEVRKELKEQHPTLSNADLLGLISEQWKNMSEEQKAASRTYNQAMKTAKDQYTEEKKAYDNRTPQEIEAANAAAAAAASLKKANSKPRGPKPSATPAPAVKARPPPTADEISPSSVDSSEEDDSEEDEPPAPIMTRPADSDSSEDEDSESEPATKKRRGASPQATVQKGKKGSKA
ncbi:hypothetical protein CVT25_014535 [Psilocybe cyanescens]|uniref:HMG box domain-containing protein n=1 Tax=Psilocybe cyanescens TaxID=93625 RepID=A0A409WRE8_PSICY|nr:hypothetical protein CVT25_014535 [Psilocybe cyanescens]